MRLPALALAALAALSSPAASADGPPFALLGSLRSDLKGQQVPGLSRVVEEAYERAAAEPPDQRDRVLDRYLPSINAAVPDQAPPRLNDSVASLNNSAERWGDALRFSDRSLQADPRDTRALVNRSRANLGLQRFDQAYQDADRAAKIEPENAEILRARAMAQYKLGHYLDAEQDARRALALDPNDRGAFYIMQLASSKVPAMKVDRAQPQLAGEVQREYHGMVQQLNQAAERAQVPPATVNAADAYVRAAWAKMSIKDYQGAIAEADKALQADPDNAAAFYFRAAANNILGDYAQAAADATRALMLDPTDSRARDTRAWAYNNQAKFRDAIADANHSLELNPSNPYAFWNLGYAREHTGDLDGMLEALKAAAELSPQFEPAYRDAAARHGFDTQPLSAAKLRPAAQAAAPADQARRRSFSAVVISSVIGGLLIALGFLHLVGDAKTAAPQAGAPALPDLGVGYALGPAIGSGGMGVVYEAFDRSLQRKVAVKVMRPETVPDPKARQRFLEEARTVAALHHPAIVDIHAIVEDKAGLCLIFERIEGRTVEEILRERKRLSLSEARSLLRPVCQGLEFAHQHGVVHRDLKPGNIMVTTGGQVKLMDFGISRHEGNLRSPLTPLERATARGTPHYMAPEQEYGEVRRESDIFSLGCCLYEMVTGQRPYISYSLNDKLNRNYPRASHLAAGLPPALDALIDEALNPDPHERPQGAAEFLSRLEKLESAPAVAA